MPMILATSAVHTLADAQGIADASSSLNVRSAECIDPHYFAVLIGCGATSVNAYLAEDSIADRIHRGLIDGTLTEAMRAVSRCHRPGLAKDHAPRWGSAVISSYRGGLEFRGGGAVSRAMVAEYFPGMAVGFPAIGVYRHPAQSRPKCMASAGAAGRTFCRLAASTKRANRVRRMLGKRCDAHAAERPVRAAV